MNSEIKELDKFNKFMKIIVREDIIKFKNQIFKDKEYFQIQMNKKKLELEENKLLNRLQKNNIQEVEDKEIKRQHMVFLQKIGKLDTFQNKSNPKLKRAHKKHNKERENSKDINDIDIL